MPVVTECTIKFDAMEGALQERLGRRPEFAELVEEFVRQDRTGLVGGMLGMLTRIRAPKEIMYAYMRTTRVLWPFNFRDFPIADQTEWKESIDRFFKVHMPDIKRPSEAVHQRDWQKTWERAERHIARSLRAGRV